MFNKISTLIANNKKDYARKARILGGVVLGIGIGLLMNKDDEDDRPDFIIVGKIVREEENDFEGPRSIEDLSDENIVGEG